MKLMVSTNTHDYDGKLNKLPSIAVNEADIFQLYFRLRNPHALGALKLMLTDHKNNYDPTNQLHALELLTRILQSKQLQECWAMFEEQMADIILSGPCAQGRCARLYQLYMALNDH